MKSSVMHDVQDHVYSAPHEFSVLTFLLFKCRTSTLLSQLLHQQDITEQQVVIPHRLPTCKQSCFLINTTCL